uniref:Uncharacterized protein n=1 Tax=Strigamia maritima TaxID=126957 RepID=T1JBH2_STRMM
MTDNGASTEASQKKNEIPSLTVTEAVNFCVGEEDEDQTDSFRDGSTRFMKGNSTMWKDKRRQLRPSMSTGTLLHQKRLGEQKDFSVATPEEFVKRFGGKLVINKVLIANNGIAAVKCMRSIRRWAYEMFKNEKAIRFVVMVTPEDLKANAEYIKMADHYVPVAGGSNNNNYANCEVILDIARRMKVQAVWAGWGHASENPKLPHLLHINNIAFIGPPEKAMWALGDKIASSIVAQTAEIPTLPWSGSGLKADWAENDLHSSRKLKIPQDLYRKGCTETVEEGLQAAQTIGFPVMVKASEGGGGKGIRKAENVDEFSTAFRQVQAEVPGSPIFVMKLAISARHLEVQLLGDQYGNAISLFGRDCSIQRRHQKIIEEAPCVIANQEVFEQMEKSAVRLAKMVGYVSAGTVEYLYNEDGTYAFLELNPRLQVEHPCTEMIADVNLPAAQLQIAMGIPLNRIKDIRLLYGESPWTDITIDFENPPHKPRPWGHVIAARITSENPDEGFKPSSGTVQELNFRSNKNVWGYFSVAASGGLHEFADSQFGHCFSWGEDREDARENLVIALKELSIRGDFRTTVEYLVTLLENETFQQNNINTGWLDILIADKVQSGKPEGMLSVTCGALQVADQAIVNAFQTFQNTLERGQILPANSLFNMVDVELIYEGLKYKLQATKTGPSNYFLCMNNSYKEAEVHRLTDGGLLLSIDGSSYTTYMKEEVDRYRIVIGNQTCVFEKDNDPSLLRSPSAGKLLGYLIDEGAQVYAGQSYAEIEVMKMVMTLSVTECGSIHFIKRPGAVLEAGSLIANLEMDDTSRCLQAPYYLGKFSETDAPTVHGDKLNQIFQMMRQILEFMLQGYCLPDPYFVPKMKETVDRFMRTLRDPNLPLLELQEIISSISGRIPVHVEKKIRKLMSLYASNITSVLAQFPSQQIASVIDSHAATLQKRTDRDVFFMTTQAIVQLVQRYRNGIRGRMKAVVQELLRQYLNVEIRFQQGHYDKCVSLLRETYKDDMATVVANIFSHSQVAKKNAIVIHLIDHLCGHEPGLTDELALILNDLTLLNKVEHSKVALRARQVLIAAHQPAYELRHNQMESIFLSAIDMYGHDFCPENLQKLILSETSIYDVLHDFFNHTNPVVCRAALEVYVRRAYISYELTCVQHLVLPPGLSVVQFQFLLPSSHPNRPLRVSHNKLMLTTLSKDVEETKDGGTDYSTIEDCQRMGAIAAFKHFDDFVACFPQMLELFGDSPPSSPRGLENEMSPRDRLSSSTFSDEDAAKPTEPMHIMNITLPRQDDEDDNTLSAKFREFCVQQKDELIEKNMRRLTFMALHRFKNLLLAVQQHFPRYFTYRARDNFEEDRIYRHLEPGLAFQLEITRLRNYDLEALATSNQKMHLYLGKAKGSKNQEVSDYRFFIRSIIRHSDLITKEASFEYMQNEGERLLLEAMDELEVAFSHPHSKSTDCNHIFLNFVPNVIMDPTKIEESVRAMVLRYGPRLWKLRVTQAELKMTIKLTTSGKPFTIRLFVANESGYYLDISVYKEFTDARTGLIQFEAWGTKQGPLHGLPISTPYMTKDFLQQKRFQAQSLGTTYVYDFPEMLRQALHRCWETHLATHPFVPMPPQVATVVELVLDAQGLLVEHKRLPGQNNIGMVAWRVTISTPEYVNGRDIIIICNDITFQIGSFGPQEDFLFLKASELARELKIPRIFVSANSGARIGLAEEVKQLFRVAWEDPKQPDKGFKYLYLTPETFKKLSPFNSVHAELIEDEGESRYKITDIIGKDDGFGVENLRCSAMIAGETSQAYNEIVTISMVTCRAIGIGAYLVRLGQRVIQVENSHIILTGSSALNKLLGREVYTSNNQLGGVQIMYYNGVTHVSVANDLEGITTTLKWLSYVPKFRGASLPIQIPMDPVDREVQFTPTKSAYDPRWILEGRPSPINPDAWESGFFDQGSFMEVMRPWAQTVVVGRARLGGIPVGVVAVETRTVEVEVPADPANLDSEAKVMSQAGQVWFPDSAYKTAQAIKDFNREDLPLIIFANWRGFSGGMKDMYDQIVKFGAYIVDSIREYNQPILIYIPPYAELRGGAWAVIDPTINLQHMEMYADPLSRGGILEPEGIVEIKFRARDLLKVIHRNDSECQELRERSNDPELSAVQKTDLEKKITEREKMLLPMYLQVALSFADMHDTPVRMQEKGVIQDIVPWKNSRTILYWRLYRLILTHKIKQEILKIKTELSDGQIESMLRRWFVEVKGTVEGYLWEDNKVVVEWLLNETDENTTHSVIKDNIKCLKRDAALHSVYRVLTENPEVALDSLVHIMQQMSPGQRAEALRSLASCETLASCVNCSLVGWYRGFARFGWLVLSVKQRDMSYGRRSGNVLPVSILAIPDDDIVWNTTNPDFPECFQKTVLVWIPCGFLWLFAPLQIFMLIKSTSTSIPWTGLNISKLCIALILIIITIVDIGHNLHRYMEDEPVPPVNYYKSFIIFVTFILGTLFMYWEKRRGLQATGISFMFWFLLVLCFAVPYRSSLRTAVDKDSFEAEFDFILQMIFYPLIVGEFILICLSDAPAGYKKISGDNPCPEIHASFYSRMIFSWFDRMAWTGYRRPLERKDLWALKTIDNSSHIINIFNKHWKNELRKARQANRPSETARFLNSGEEVMFTGRNVNYTYQPSILKALVKSFGASFAMGSFLKLINDLLLFVNPLILELLIKFVSGNEPMWRGYLYVGLIFASSILQFIVLGQYFNYMFLVGMRVRSAVISAIYRKALRLSNSAKRSSTVGEIVNLMSVDAQRFMDLTTYLNLVWSAPLQIILALYFLWNTLGPSVLAGLVVMILLIPANGFIANKMKQLQVKQMKDKDRRVKLMNEVLSGIKVLKLYAWELSFFDQLLGIRSKELSVLRKAAYLNAFSSFIWMCAPFLVMLATFATYVLMDETHVLDASKAFVSLSLFNIVRMPMAILPMLIVGIVQVAVSTFTTYVLVDEKNILNPRTAFVSLSLFNILRFPLGLLPMVISMLVQAHVSLKRMNDYMCKDEIDPMNVTHEPSANPLSIDNGTFLWGPNDDPILNNVSMQVRKGSLVAVVGPVGAGKSSLLAALLGEMEKSEGHVNTTGSIAYVAQQAWIQNTTLKNNILFGNTLDDDRYDQVVESCALRTDLDMLPGGDETEIGEKGINLSGGQKQRVSLARAVYTNADTYLLDDPLSAVDSHVGKHIFDKVIGPSGLLKTKTRILVTHGITYLPQVDTIVVLDGGSISEVGSYKELLEKKGAFADFLMTYLSEGDNEDNSEGSVLQEIKEELISKIGEIEVERRLSHQMSRALSNSSHTSIPEGYSPRRQLSNDVNSLSHQNNVAAIDNIKDDGTKLVKTETSETGQVKYTVYIHYLRSVGFLFALMTLLVNFFAQGCSVGSNIWLGLWSNDKPINGTTQDTELRDLRLGIYGLLGFLQALLILVGSLTLAKGCIEASSFLHMQMLDNILHSPMSFFDTTPLGRIVNRFSKDVDVVDTTLPMTIRSWLNCLLSVVATMVVISISTPIFLAVILPLGVIYYFIQKFYVATSRQLKRLESVSRSPIYSHFGETVTGATTIRAYNRQNQFILHSESTVDENQVCYYPSIIANRWLAIRLELVGGFIVTSAALFAVLGRETMNPGLVGLSVSYALSVTATLNWMVRMSSELETNIVAVERIKEYTETPQEAEWAIEERKPPPPWPHEGVVKFNNYKTRYREGLELVLHGITCSVAGGEKIGIVGRTGAGKSSLTLALFRLIEPTSGNIMIDDLDVTKMGLHDLRSKLTIIPQDPVLFSGTLRINLDPFSVHSDDEVWTCLEQSHLKPFISTLAMGLQYEIAEGGENLSVGQRQLVCLARALLRKTKVLILDEATAAVDLETDDLIQATIRKEFADCTIITIAHRLNTIMDSNRIMVLDKGTIKEFQSPVKLLQDHKSLFYAMAKDAGLV